MKIVRWLVLITASAGLGFWAGDSGWRRACVIQNAHFTQGISTETHGPCWISGNRIETGGRDG